ncbi:hypothetical protein AVEN_86079-1 [Araneus ventricosus]|uniref:Uncharacterized protein n=1 Tax=Araneus ventricosus TaxID=182803 RepID=A0A4Y2IMN5_ARAVE|nr:hypothetical protein AVEN_86079-1 [Araneus ventricosus]
MYVGLVQAKSYVGGQASSCWHGSRFSQVRCRLRAVEIYVQKPIPLKMHHIFWVINNSFTFTRSEELMMEFPRFGTQLVTSQCLKPPGLTKALTASPFLEQWKEALLFPLAKALAPPLCDEDVPSSDLLLELRKI